jgi:hypothetical protein
LRITTEPAASGQASRDARELFREIYGNGAAVAVAVEKSLRHESSGKFRFCRPAFRGDHDILWKGKNE